jgi:hypothetical protein
MSKREIVNKHDDSINNENHCENYLSYDIYDN